jgi:hypothetical protein
LDASSQKLHSVTDDGPDRFGPGELLLEFFDLSLKGRFLLPQLIDHSLISAGETNQCEQCDPS